jgi:hypothetical protein
MKCSECGKRIPPSSGAGKPRLTCDARCALDRELRHRREARAAKRREPKETAHLAELGRWLR